MAELATEKERCNSKFNLTMEILATIPRHPRFVMVASLAKDFGMPSQSSLNKHFASIAALGVNVRVANGEGMIIGRTVSIPQDQWRKAEELSLGYWHKMYGVY